MNKHKLAGMLTRNALTALRSRAVILLTTLFLHLMLCNQAAAQSDRSLIVGGTWCSDDPRYALTMPQREQLTNSLRQMTGWKQLQFTAEGALVTGDSAVSEGGSALARKVWLMARQSGFRFVIEDHSGSPDVNFGQLDEGTNYFDVRRNLKLEIWRVRLDFLDFTQMQTTPEVRESFDPGFTLLHELLHGLGYKDTRVPGELGECEQLVNRIRAELGLPQRLQYHGEIIRLSRWIASVRLRFRSLIPASANDAGKMRWKNQYLYFLALLRPEFAAGQSIVKRAGEKDPRLVE